MIKKQVIDSVLNQGITQVALADYLGVARQTVAKIKENKYTKLSEFAANKLRTLENRSKDELDKLIEIDGYIKAIGEEILMMNLESLDYAIAGIKYMHYWICDANFENKNSYQKYYFGHLNNFYPRFNQAALFMRDTLNRQVYPVITVQLDYKKKIVKNYCIKSFLDKYDKIEYSNKESELPITIDQFVEEVFQKVNRSTRFLVYGDYKDDEWSFIMKHNKSKKIAYQSFYDLSRLFNHFSNEQPYFGPLLEDVLNQFEIPFELDKLLLDCEYRALKIIKLVNMVSLQNLHEEKYDKSSLLFDSHTEQKDMTYQQKIRRRLKSGEGGVYKD